MSELDSQPTETGLYASRIDRRTTLAWLTGAVAVGLAGGPEAAPIESYMAAPGGYGTDPKLTHPTAAPWPRIMSKPQLQTAALMCDFILPASADAPSATALGVPDFIDEWISAPYPAQVADRPVVLDGLKWVEDEAQRRHRADLLHVAPVDRSALLMRLARKPSDPSLAAPHAFFRKFRSADHRRLLHHQTRLQGRRLYGQRAALVLSRPVRRGEGPPRQRAEKARTLGIRHEDRRSGSHRRPALDSGTRRASSGGATQHPNRRGESCRPGRCFSTVAP